MDGVPEIAGTYLSTDVLVREDGAWVRAADSSLVSAGPFHVITAWNPGEQRPAEAANRAANDRLQRELRSRGLDPLPAIGRDPASDHAEESWAVTGLTDDEARAIGAAFGQVAVFRITAGEQSVLGCDEPWRVTRALQRNGSD